MQIEHQNQVVFPFTRLYNGKKNKKYDNLKTYTSAIL